MFRKTLLWAPLLLSLAALVFSPQALSAYGGPGSIVSGIGALIAAIIALLAAIFGFFWFPLKRLFGWGDDQEDEQEPTE